jgi:hypothetical protein
VVAVVAAVLSSSAVVGGWVLLAPFVLPGFCAPGFLIILAGLARRCLPGLAGALGAGGAGGLPAAAAVGPLLARGRAVHQQAARAGEGAGQPLAAFGACSHGRIS